MIVDTTNGYSEVEIFPTYEDYLECGETVWVGVFCDFPEGVDSGEYLPWDTLESEIKAHQSPGDVISVSTYRGASFIYEHNLLSINDYWKHCGDEVYLFDGSKSHSLPDKYWIKDTIQV